MSYEELRSRNQIKTKSSDDGKEVTPVPIPNTAVKLFSADGTWGAAPWESRLSLVSFLIV